jgi:hypothetical protein
MLLFGTTDQYGPRPPVFRISLHLLELIGRRSNFSQSMCLDATTKSQNNHDYSWIRTNNGTLEDSRRIGSRGFRNQQLICWINHIVTCYATEDTHFELLLRLFTT